MVFWKQARKKGPVEESMELFQELFEAEEYEKALDVVKDLIELAPKMSTSWFNYGACLDHLDRHDEAAEAYYKAYKLEENEEAAARILYRCCHSLVEGNNGDRLYEVLSEKLKEAPWMVTIFSEEPDFALFLEQQRFKDLVAKYTEYLE